MELAKIPYEPLSSGANDDDLEGQQTPQSHPFAAALRRSPLGARPSGVAAVCIGAALLILMIFKLFGSSMGDQGVPEYPIGVFEDEKWDFSPFQELCSSTKWHPDTWFVCDSIEGGLGNIQSEVLHCLRYGIEVGASIVLPSINRRGALDSTDPDSLRQGGRAGLDFLYDLPYLRSSLSSVCPQLRTVDRLIDVPNYDNAIMPDVFLPRDLVDGRKRPWSPLYWTQGIEEFPTRWRKSFEAWVPRSSPASPVICRIGFPVYFEWPLIADSTQLWQTFGRILRFRSDASGYAAEVYRLLNRKAASFHGAHLRVEADVQTGGQKGNWGTEEGQTSMIIDHAKSHGLTYIYVACGDPDAFERFRRVAAAQGLKAVSKYSILPSSTLSRVQAMEFDQQAIVDFLVLLKAKHFSGVGMSSFSQTIGTRRHRLSETGNDIFRGSDELSTLWNGPPSVYFWQSVWP